MIVKVANLYFYFLYPQNTSYYFYQYLILEETVQQSVWVSWTLDSVVRGGSRGNARGARGFQIPSSIPKQTTTKMWILFLSTKITCHTLLYSQQIKLLCSCSTLFILSNNFLNIRTQHICMLRRKKHVTAFLVSKSKILKLL